VASNKTISKLSTRNWPHPQTSLTAYHALRECAVREVLLYGEKDSYRIFTISVLVKLSLNL